MLQPLPATPSHSEPTLPVTSEWHTKGCLWEPKLRRNIAHQTFLL